MPNRRNHKRHEKAYRQYESREPAEQDLYTHPSPVRKKDFKTPVLNAKTENQHEYIRSIIQNKITICSGPAGCGKSFIAAGLASEHILAGKIENIIVTRPLVCTGSNIGSLPGELHEKINPFLVPMQENLKFFLGIKMYGFYTNEKQIRFEPLELMRGATFNNAYMILDEAQNCTLEQIKMFITRMGRDSKVLINGDVRQTDLRGQNGLDSCMDRLSHLMDIGICKLTHDDIQRNDIIASVLRALED